MKKVIKKCLSQCEDKDYFYIKWFKKNLILSAAAALSSGVVRVLGFSAPSENMYIVSPFYFIRYCL